MLLSTIGALLMVSAQHLASFFMSFRDAVYTAIRHAVIYLMRNRSLESGLKYLVLVSDGIGDIINGYGVLFMPK